MKYEIYETMDIGKVVMRQGIFWGIFMRQGTDYRGVYHTPPSQKRLNLSLFLDLKKDFDTVDHQIIVKKLNAIGVRGIAGDWFAFYLSNGKQYCSLGDQKSSESLVTCGIPQRYCLGPLLFIIYLNDFEDCLVLSKAGTRFFIRNWLIRN